MKKRLIAMAAMFLAVFALAGDGSGLNPQFLKWRKMKAAGMLPQQKREYQAQKAARDAAQRKNALLATRRGVSLVGSGIEGDGLVPDIFSFSYLKDLKDKKTFGPVGGYPSSYDLRSAQNVTAVRNQGSFNACWAFATLASMESAVLVQKPSTYSYTAADIDFSEAHMVDNHGFDLSVKQGGSMMMSMAYLLRWGGPVSESDRPYPAPGTTEWSKSSVIANPRLHAQQVRIIPGKSISGIFNEKGYLDNDAIKDAIMNYGAVYATFIWNEAYFNAANSAYRCPRVIGSGEPHGVAIVGWDDNFPASKFGKIALDDILIGNGAYLVKNSWGSDWGDDGYFWVSYYDAYFATAAMAVFSGNESKANYKTIYQYDELGCTGSHGGGTTQGKAWMANIFTATTNDTIAAVGFYSLAPNTQYHIRIFTEVPAGGTPWDGTPKDSCETTGTTDFAGYVTIPLKKMVPVEAGSRFAVCVNLYSPGLDKPLAYEAPVGGYSTLAGAAEGQSFYSPKGNKWYDLTKNVRGANFCVKAYGLADQSEIDHKADVLPKSLDVKGPFVVAAGESGQFEVTLVFDDNSRWNEFPEVEYSIVEGAGAVSAVEAIGNVVTVTVRSDLAEDTTVAMRFSVYHDDSDIEVPATVSFVATKAKPSVPEDFTVTAGTVDTGVRMSWSAVPNASMYKIYRSESGREENKTFLDEVDVVQYTDITAEPGIDYTYFLKAVNSSGSSDFTEGRDGWRKLAAPENLAATDGDFDYVQLTWNAAEGANYYKVYRAEDMDAEGNPDTNTLVEVTEWIDQLAFRDTPPAKDKVYFYWVKSALSWTGYRASDYSIFDAGNRKAPVTLSAVAIQGPATVSAGSTAAYTLMAELSNGSRIEKVTNAVWTCSLDGGTATGDEYSLTALVNGELVASNTIVTVTASWSFTNEDGTTSQADSKVVVIAPVVPAKPNAVKIADLTTDGAALEWNPVEGASSYNLYRGATAETAELLLSTSELAYMDTKLIPGATYRYWLEAVNSAGASEKSDASADAMRQFTAPIYVSASNGTSTEDVTVTWRGVTGANYYRVSRADAPDGAKHDLSGWIGRTTFADTTATPGVTYWYFVEAAFDANGGSGSGYSAATIGRVSPAQTLTFIEIGGPSVIQYDSQGAFVCTATYANGVQKRVQPTWSFKAAHPLVSVSADGIVSAGHVEGDDLHLELQASYTDNGVTKTDSFAVTVIAFTPVVPQVFVSNVVVRARWPWNGLVDISYDLYSVPATTRAVVTVSGHDHDLGRALQAVSLEGDGVERPAAGGTPHLDCRVTWNLGADYTNFHASAFSVSLDAAPFTVAAPADFRASDGTSTNGVELAWEEAFGAAYYEIFRSLYNTTNGATKVATVTNLTEYLDATAESGETYYYWIRTIAGEFPEDVSELAGPVNGKRAQAQESGAVNLMDGLVAYYPLDGDKLDASGNNRHLSGESECGVHASSGIEYDNDTWWRNDCNMFDQGYDGCAGSAFVFGGYGSGLFPDNGYTVASNFTFACWVRTERDVGSVHESTFGTGIALKTGRYNSVLSGEDFTNGLAACGLNVGTNGLSITVGDDAPSVEHRCALGTNWHHVAFTAVEGGALTLYLDGGHVGTGISGGNAKCINIGHIGPGNPQGPTYDPRPPRLEGVDRFFAGSLDEVCIYGKALTAEEIAALYENGRPNETEKRVSAAPRFTVVENGATAEVTITCAEAGATVYYSISRRDGGATVDSREYTVPFTVEGNATVTAWSVTPGCYNSPRVVVEIKAGWKKTAHDTLAGTDTDGLVDFDTFGDSDWVFDPNESSDNVGGSMRSGAIGAEGVSTMVAKVSGAGAFAFDWKVSSESGFDYLSVTVDGEFAHKISGEVDWTQLVIDLTNDTEHVITWTYSKDASVDRGRDCGWVDFVTWAPEGSMVDSPVATVTPVDGGASNRVELATAIPGAAIEYRLVIFGEEGEWTAYEGPFVVEGDGEIYMRAKKPGYVDSFVSKDVIKRPWIVRANEALLMDAVTKSAVTLSPDYFEYGFEEAYWWDQDRTTVSDGTWASMKSPKLGDREAASIYAAVSGPGTLYFDRKIDSEAGWDVLTYYAGENGFDYSYAEAISGDKDWERVKLVFYANDTHVIEWEYDKDEFGKNGRDCAWIDYLKWVPARFAPVTPDPRTGYVFGGFATNENGVAVYDAGTQLDAEDPNETFFPVWTPITYTIKYAAQAENEDVETVATLTYDQPYTLLAATNFVFRRGYAFDGWATNANGAVALADNAEVVNLAAEQDAEIVLTPVLDAIGYTVKFFDGASAAAPDVAATYDVAFTMPTPAEREGFVFDGWAHTPNGEVMYAAGASATNLADTQGAVVRFYARWTLAADPLGQAIEQPTFEMRSSGNAEWFVQSAVVKYGATALQSGRIGANQSSVLETTLVTASRVRISFWWKVSSEQGWDFLKFSVNGAVKGSISGTAGDWQQFTVVLPAGTNTLCWEYSKDGSVDRGDDCGWLDWFTVEELAVVGENGDVFVAENGSDETGNGSEAKPFRTIQKGVDWVANGKTVYVKPGVYPSFRTDNRSITIESTDGAAVTFVDGVSSNRCATLADNVGVTLGCAEGKVATVLRGLTLRNGYILMEGCRGGGGGVQGGTLYNCVIKANVSSDDGGGALGSRLVNCVVIVNYAGDSGLAISGGGCRSCSLYNCTVYDNRARSNGAGIGYCLAYNSIIWHNYLDNGVEDNIAANTSYRCQLYNCITDRDPLFKDAANGDFTLKAGSPAINAGKNEYVYYAADFSGNARIINGTVDLGAYEYGSGPGEDIPLPGAFTVIQYSTGRRPYTMDDANSIIANPSYWSEAPATNTYQRICFSDNEDQTSVPFYSSKVSFPGNVGHKRTYYAVEAKGYILIPEAGEWTFCCGSDDGFAIEIVGDNFQDSVEYYDHRNYNETVKVFNFPKAGVYQLRAAYFEYGEASTWILSVAKGRYSSMNTSYFKLLGTPESGITTCTPREKPTWAE